MYLKVVALGGFKKNSGMVQRHSDESRMWVLSEWDGIEEFPFAWPFPEQSLKVKNGPKFGQSYLWSHTNQQKGEEEENRFKTSDF